MKDPTAYQSDWDPEELKEIQELAKYFDSLTEEEWIAHDEYAYENPYTVDVLVPKALLSTVRDMIARHEADHPEATAAAQVWHEWKPDGPGNFPPGWNSERVQRLIAEMAAEDANWTAADEAELQARMKGKTSIQVPNGIIPAIQALLAHHEAGTPATDRPANHRAKPSTSNPENPPQSRKSCF